MKIILFIILEIAGFIFLSSFLKLLFFYHFPKKIKLLFKSKKLPPLLSRKLDKIIKKYEFKYVGVRVEKIFFIFSTKFYLYKNDRNIYLDISKSNNKFYYFSYKKDKIKMLFLKHQFKEYNKEVIEFDIFTDTDSDFEDGIDIDRVEIAKTFYENVEFLPFSIRLFSYSIFLFFIIQFIYLFIKWV